MDYSDKQLCEACRKYVGEVYLARISRISAWFGVENTRFWIGNKEVDADFCFLRSLGIGSLEQMIRRATLMEHMEIEGIPIINSAKALMRARDKYASLITLFKAGLPIPRTFVTEMAGWAYRMCEKFEKFVYKPIIGSLGFGSMLFEDKDLAFNAYKTLQSLGQPLYIQEYLKPSKDIRAFVINGEVIASMERKARPESWKANVAQGGKVKPVKLNEDEREAAVKSAEVLNLFYAGVDIIEVADEFKILEVNGAPNWRGLQEVTSVNIAEKLVKEVLGVLRR